MRKLPKKLAKVKKLAKEAPNKPASAFAGITWQPMTVQRQMLACEMGLRYGFVFPYAPSKYLLKDTIIWLWVASLPLPLVDRAETSIEWAGKQSREWAAKVGIGVGTPAFQEGWHLFIDQYNAIVDSKGHPVMPSGTTEEDESEC